MPYLSFAEFKDLAPQIDIEESEFNSLLRKASAVLNNITSYFYVKNDMEKDNSWRVKQFKKALCAQIEYFHEVGSTTSEGINSAPRSFTAGRTTVTNDSRYKTSGENETKSLISDDVFIYLEGTGLLFTGVSVW